MVQILLSKYATKGWFNFPPQLFCIHTLPWENFKIPKIASNCTWPVFIVTTRAVNYRNQWAEGYPLLQNFITYRICETIADHSGRVCGRGSEAGPPRPATPPSQTVRLINSFIYLLTYLLTKLGRVSFPFFSSSSPHFWLWLFSFIPNLI